MTDAELLALAQRALEAPHGIEVAVSSPSVFRSRFYAMRAAAEVPALFNLTLATHPTEPDKYVWLKHKVKSNAQE